MHTCLRVNSIDALLSSIYFNQKQKRFLMSSLNLANCVKYERCQRQNPCGNDDATPDCLQFSARPQTLAMGKYGPAIVRLQQQYHPKTAIWWLRP